MVAATTTNSQPSTAAAAAAAAAPRQLRHVHCSLDDPYKHHHCPLRSKEPLLQQQQQQPKRRMLHATAFTRNEAAVVTKAAEDVMPPIVWTTHRLDQTQIAKVDRIFHKILWLDIFETAMLNELVNERLGLQMSPKQRRQLTLQMEARDAVRSGNNALSHSAEAEPEEAGPILVDLKLAGFDAAAKIKVIKEVRSILGLGLKEAKEMVEGAPVTLQKGLKQETADELKVKLEAAGAKIELV